MFLRLCRRIEQHATDNRIRSTASVCGRGFSAIGDDLENICVVAVTTMGDDPMRPILAADASGLILDLTNPFEQGYPGLFSNHPG